MELSFVWLKMKIDQTKTRLDDENKIYLLLEAPSKKKAM